MATERVGTQKWKMGGEKKPRQERRRPLFRYLNPKKITQREAEQSHGVH